MNSAHLAAFVLGVLLGGLGVLAWTVRVVCRLSAQVAILERALHRIDDVVRAGGSP